MHKNSVIILEYYGTAGEELVAQNQECATTVHDAISCLGKIARGETCEGHNLADLKQTFKYAIQAVAYHSSGSMSICILLLIRSNLFSLAFVMTWIPKLNLTHFRLSTKPFKP